MQSKTPHERRTHAMQVAGGVTALALLVWLGTLGIRFDSTPPQTADSNDTSQLASVVSSQDGNATLIVSTTTDSTADNSNSAFPNSTQY